MSPTVLFKFIGYRQVANGSYPAWTFVVAQFLAQLPFAALESIIFSMFLYWMSGLTIDAGRYFFFLLIAWLSDVFAATMLRCFALAAPSLIVAQMGPMPLIAILTIFAGYVILCLHLCGCLELHLFFSQVSCSAFENGLDDFHLLYGVRIVWHKPLLNSSTDSTR